MPGLRRIHASRFGTFQYHPDEDRYDFDDGAKQLLGALAHPTTSYGDILARIPPEVRRDYERWRQEAVTREAGRVRVPFDLLERRIILEVHLQPAGEVVHGVVANVTRAEREYRELVEAFSVMEMATRLAHLGVWAHDLQRDRFTASPEAAELLAPGSDPSLFTLDQALARMHPHDAQAVQQAERRALATGQVQRAEVCMGDRWMLLQFMRALDEEGQPAQTCGIVHETTDMHQRASLEHAHTQLKGLDEMRARFVSAAAHEINQPLTPMRLQLASLRDKLPHRPDLHRSFDVIDHNISRLSLLMNDLLDSVRWQAGSLRIEVEKTHVPEQVAHVVDTFSDLAATRNVGLDWQPEPVPPVHADPFRLQQCLSNLIHNAIKFTLRGTDVCIRTSAEAPHVVVHVDDHGPGLDPDQAKRVFEPFERVHRGPPGFAGTGLGLYVTRALMDAMGGSIGVESTPGTGSRFCLRIPIA